MTAATVTTGRSSRVCVSQSKQVKSRNVHAAGRMMPVSAAVMSTPSSVQDALMLCSDNTRYDISLVRSNNVIYFIIAAFIVMLDQIVKYCITLNMGPASPHLLFPVLSAWHIMRTRVRRSAFYQTCDGCSSVFLVPLSFCSLPE